MRRYQKIQKKETDDRRMSANTGILLFVFAARLFLSGDFCREKPLLNILVMVYNKICMGSGILRGQKGVGG